MLGEGNRKGVAGPRASRAAAFGCGAAVVLGVLSVGCTGDSLRVALASQRRADEVQRAVFDAQHTAVRMLLYRDLVGKLEGTEGALSASQKAALNEAWNERDLAEHWAVQFERASALRLIGVDAKLFADQSPVDLLIKSVKAKADRVQAATEGGTGNEE